MARILFQNTDKELGSSLEGLFASYENQLINVIDDQSLINRSVEDKPDLIILDADPSAEKTLATCKTLSLKRKTNHIPILVLITEQGSLDLRVQFQRAGAFDCLGKPFTPGHLITRVQTILRRSHVHDKMRRVSVEKNQIRDQLSQEIEKLHQINRTIIETDVIDHLTGIYNKLYFMLCLREEFHRSMRYETALSLVVIDIDSFSLINNNFGNAVGDYILMKIANTLLLCSRPADIAARLDGAAFAVILPGMDVQGGIFDAERFRIAIQQTEYIEKSILNVKDSISGKKFPKIELTASIGVASIPCTVSLTNEEDFFDLAMRALGQAKSKGKNRTVSAAELGAE